MYKRLVAYCIIGLFITAILLQLGSYFSITSTTTTTSTPASLPPTLLQHDRYQRDYTTLVTYVLTLTSCSMILVFNSWFAQYKYEKSKLIGVLSVLNPPHSSFQKWLRYERRWFSCITWSFLDLFKIAGLTGLNVLILFRDLNQDDVAFLEDRNMYLQTLANRSAQLAVTNIAFTVLLSAKLSIIQRSFCCIHQTLNCHTWFGRLGFLQVLYHGIYQFQYNYEREGGNIFATVTTNVRYVTGFSMLTALTVLILGSHPTVRYISYHLFRWTHMCAFIVLILFGCLHHWSFYIFYATVLVFWVMDQIDRSFITESVTVESLPGDIVKMTCQVPFHSGSLIPGQFAFISFGSTSWIKAWFHSHPFSICRFDRGGGGKVVFCFINIFLLTCFNSNSGLG
jgi:hypothetical protein